MIMFTLVIIALVLYINTILHIRFPCSVYCMINGCGLTVNGLYLLTFSR